MGTFSSRNWQTNRISICQSFLTFRLITNETCITREVCCIFNWLPTLHVERFVAIFMTDVLRSATLVEMNRTTLEGGLLGQEKTKEWKDVMSKGKDGEAVTSYTIWNNPKNWVKILQLMFVGTFDKLLLMFMYLWILVRLNNSSQ